MAGNCIDCIVKSVQIEKGRDKIMSKDEPTRGDLEQLGIAVVLIVLTCIVLAAGKAARDGALSRDGSQGARVHVNLGCQYAEKGHLELAEEFWVAALTYPEGNGVYHYRARMNLYHLYMNKGRLEEGIEQAKLMNEIRDRHPEVDKEDDEV